MDDLPFSSTIATNSTPIYSPSATHYTSSERRFVSVSSQCWSRSFSQWLAYLPSIGNCRGSGYFGLISDIFAFGEWPHFIEGTQAFDRRHPQINVFRPPSHLGNYTHIPVIFGSLIVANLLQSIGTIMNSRWLFLGGVSPGAVCSLQGMPIPILLTYASLDKRLHISQVGSNKLAMSGRRFGEKRAFYNYNSLD